MAPLASIDLAVLVDLVHQDAVDGAVDVVQPAPVGGEADAVREADAGVEGDRLPGGVDPVGVAGLAVLPVTPNGSSRREPTIDPPGVVHEQVVEPAHVVALVEDPGLAVADVADVLARQHDAAVGVKADAADAAALGHHDLDRAVRVEAADATVVHVTEVEAAVGRRPAAPRSGRSRTPASRRSSFLRSDRVLALGGLRLVDDRQLANTPGGSRHNGGNVPRSASWIALHTRSGVHGMSMWRTPRWLTASTTAFWIDGVEPIVPDSPMPFAPSGFSGVGVSVLVVSKLGNSAAVGMA